MNVKGGVRTLGDGMDNSLLNLPYNNNNDVLLRECTVHLDVNSSKKILKSLKPIVVPPTSKIIKLVPKYVPKERKQPKYLTKKHKEPKFVPYEPYKAAVEPIIPHKPTRAIKVTPKEATSSNKNNVEIYELVTQLSEIRVSEMNKNQLEGSKVDEIISKKQWEKEKQAYETDIKNLRESNAHLENQLKLQSQVNSELKTLLVAAVGEDLESRVQHLTEDKLQLARALLNSANHLTTHQEQVEWLSGQCEVWRSKFLASSLMVEELARWKSALTSRINELQTTLKNILEDRTKIQKNTVKLNNNLCYISDESYKPDDGGSNKLKSLTIIDLTNVNLQLCERISNRFGLENYNAIFTENVVLLNHTPSERNALKLLQNPVYITNKQEVICNAVVGAALSCGEQMFLQHPSSRATCCAHCTGEITNI